MTGLSWIDPSTGRFLARKGKFEGRASVEKTVALAAAEAQAATQTKNLWSYVVGAIAHLRLPAGKPRGRPLARIRARRAALGFPYRHPPRSTVPAKPERDCDCVPWSW